MMALHPRTDAGSFCVYDPAAIPERIPPMSLRKLETKLAEDVDAANLLLFDPHADGDYWLNLFVEEEVPERFAKRAQSRASGHLRIPSGRLFAVGTEELATRRKRDSNVSPKMGDETTLSPGIYAVEAFTLNWHGREINAELKKRTNKQALRKHRRLETVMAVAFYTALFGGIAFVVKLINRGLVNWGNWLAVLFPLFALVLFCFRWYGRSEITRIRNQVESEFPFVVLQFRSAKGQADAVLMKGFKMDLDQ